MTQHFILHPNDTSRPRVLANLIDFLQKLPDSKAWEISIVRFVKTRTDKQRKALFGAAYKALMEFSGLQGSEDKNELHRFMCGEYFGWIEDAFGRKTPARTTTKNEQRQREEISVESALDFYAFLQRRGAEVGCFVPDPDPFWKEGK